MNCSQARGIATFVSVTWLPRPYHLGFKSLRRRNDFWASIIVNLNFIFKYFLILFLNNLNTCVINFQKSSQELALKDPRMVFTKIIPPSSPKMTLSVLWKALGAKKIGLASLGVTTDILSGSDAELVDIRQLLSMISPLKLKRCGIQESVLTLGIRILKDYWQ